MSIVTFIFAYLMVGLFVFSFMEEWSSGGRYEWMIFLWPMLIAVCVLLGVLAIPIIAGRKIAEWIGQLF